MSIRRWWREIVMGARPFKGIQQWIYARQTQVTSWWTHERILQAWTLTCYLAFASWGQEPIAASLAALGGGVYWLREVLPAARHAPSDPVDTLLDYTAAWWGVFETILAWHGALYFIGKAL